MRKTPLWKAIADSLREAIANGQYPEGTRLPSEADLAARFGVNRHTVRHGMDQLINDGLIHRRRGAGAFVLARPVDYPLGKRVRFHQSLLAAGRLPGKKVLSVETRGANDTEARLLDLVPGDKVCVRHGVSSANGVVVSVGEAIFPECRLPGLGDILKTEPSVTRALSAVGVQDYTRKSTRVSAVPANSSQAAHLQVSEGAALLMTSSINIDESGIPVEFGKSWFVGDRISLTLGPED